jgi:hypothetical protein
MKCLTRETILGLLLILLVASFVTKTSWNNKGGLFIRDGSSNIDGYMDSAKQISRGEWKEILSYRPTQILYPAILSPIFTYSLDEQNYVFALHLIFSLLRVIFCFLIGVELLSPRYGLLTALFAALFPLPLAWLTWATTETMYYAILTAAVFLFLRLWKTRGNPMAFLMISLLLLFTKLDTLPFLFASWSVIFIQRVSGRFDRKVAITSWLGIILCLGAISVSTLFFHSGIQQKVRDHFHVAVGLWVSTRTSTNANALEHNAAMEALSNAPITCPDGQKELCTRRYMVDSSLEILRKNPGRFFSNAVLRFTALVAPALYHTHWPWRYRLLHLSLTLFVVMGAIFAWRMAETKEEKSLLGLMLLLGFSTLGVATFYENDAENRFRIPSQLILGLAAIRGWIRCLAVTTLRHSLIK